MNKLDVVRIVAKKVDLPQKKVDETITEFLNTIQNSVAKGRRVVFVGFGAFEPNKRAARTGRNPQTSEAVPIPARIKPLFKPGKNFKKIVGEMPIDSFVEPLN